jgi:hypothetical protein
MEFIPCFSSSITAFLAVWTLDEPLLFLYDSLQHKYGIYPLISTINSQQIQLEPILEYIIKNYTDIIQYSGDTWSKRLFRPFWELYRTIIAMFIEAPFISMLIIGIPALVISLICYCLCCSSNDNSSVNSKGSKRRRPNGQDEQDQGSMGEEEEDDDEYEERIVEIEPKFIEKFIKPADARDIPAWPIMPEDHRKSPTEKKQD